MKNTNEECSFSLFNIFAAIRCMKDVQPFIKMRLNLECGKSMTDIIY